MARDLMRMLTEITPTQQPVPGTPGFRGMFGQQQAQRLQGSLGSVARGGAPSSQARMQQALSGLDLTKPEGLAKLAKIQQGTGDFAGAAQTAARIEAMRVAAINEERNVRRDELAESQEARLVDSAARQVAKAAVDALRQQTSDKQAARRAEITEEKYALELVKNKETLTKEEQEKTDNAELRTLYIQTAKDRGMPDLAEALKLEGFPLSRAENLLHGSTQLSQAKAPSDDEAAAMNAFLTSPAFAENIKGLPTKWYDSDAIKPDTKRAIFYNAKELMRKDRNLSVEDALVGALDSVKKLYNIVDAPTPEPEDPHSSLKKGGR